MEFSKPATTFDEQIALLKKRGMQIDDPDRARYYLGHINYYRLRAYWLPFESDRVAHRFIPGTRFEDALNLYSFDRELRLLLLDAIERVEVSVRTQWAYHMAHLHGPHAYLDAAHSRKSHWHAKNLAILQEEISRSDEVFIDHYQNTYTKPDSPPIWAVCEVMSLGVLSRWLTQLTRSDRNRIAQAYSLDESVLQAFIRHLTYVRNLCAHHSRVWNRGLTVIMKLPRGKPHGLAENFNKQAERRIYNTIVMLIYMLDIASPGHCWTTRLRNAIRDHGIDTAPMGFPANFADRPIWQTS